MERRASPAQTFVADPEQYSASLLLLKEVGLNQSQERIITLWALRYAHSNEHIRVQRQTQNIAAGSKSSESTTTPGQEEQRSQTEARTQEFTKNKAGTETSFPASEYRRAVEVVEEQLDAIRDRDAHKIWQGMSENLQSSFRSPNEALADIRLNQKPLYGHLSYQLIESMERDENLIQKVELIGKNGRRVLSFFSLQKAKNGVWKINRITILDPKSQAI